jgi:hypothetical protein
LHACGRWAHKDEHVVYQITKALQWLKDGTLVNGVAPLAAMKPLISQNLHA